MSLQFPLHAPRPPCADPPDGTRSLPEYDGKAAFPRAGTAAERTGGERLSLAITALIVFLPFLALGLAVWRLWGRLIDPADVLIAAVLYAVTGFGVTVGFHRGLTHNSYRAVRLLRTALAVAGSMSFQGDVIGWVAIHRRHHAFTDRPGDPHSPYRYGTSVWGQVRGLVDAHVGWLFRNDPTSAARYAPDLLADRDIRAVSRAFPALCGLTLALPFGAGWLIGGSWVSALTALLWAGLVRIALLHHVTWSVNSLCHVIGERPFRTRRYDRATNLWPLALLSFGESWHNLHHADPTCARHGVDRGQLDASAAVIRLFERLGWVRDVRWPLPDRIAARRA
ncbi:acyl-CoA desaturase [Streptomyces sp. TLI_146]|uniref:acyl-CoA desaturase n=1 Tax=Streptomyces sp. TLI_146 TaxID=1938858 RepID=UPI000C7131CD|nr:acyl-CoA desaturase [Streptomyces sp. TLI_146]PKV90051.1 stearoyl-CoA desaturase (delta-9 desaturase) [Streptomyces sp. TLI_146]